MFSGYNTLVSTTTKIRVKIKSIVEEDVFLFALHAERKLSNGIRINNPSHLLEKAEKKEIRIKDS